MHIEHIGLSVPEPLKMAAWYQTHLGFSIRTQAGDDGDGVAFITAQDQQIMLELFRLPEVPQPDYRSWQPLQLHIALTSADPDADCSRLQIAGAEYVEHCARKMPGDVLILMRDPWGLVIQLVKRGPKMAGEE
jgi:glyoxylase I family protein